MLIEIRNKIKKKEKCGGNTVTYCIGYKSATSVFLIADSIITSGKKEEIEEAFGDFTTFGESVANDELTVQERTMKVYKLPSNVLVTFAGDVSIAREALSIYKKQLQEGFSPIEAFEFVIAAGPFPNIELLIGFIENEQPKLYSYNFNKNGLLKEEHGPVHLGSGRDHEFLTRKTELFSEFIIEESFSDGKQLVYMLAFLQNFAMKNQMIPLGVGGFFYGGFVNINGVQRMSNTTYLMYAVTEKNGERKLYLNYQISLTRKGDLLLVSSTFVDHERLFIEEIDEEDVYDINTLKRRVNELRDDFWGGKVKFTVLLNQLNYGFIICFMENPNKLPEIQITPNKELETFNFRLTPRLKEKLLHLFSLKNEDIKEEWDRNNPAHLEIPISWLG